MLLPDRQSAAHLNHRCRDLGPSQLVRPNPQQGDQRRALPGLLRRRAHLGRRGTLDQHVHRGVLCNHIADRSSGV